MRADCPQKGKGKGDVPLPAAWSSWRPGSFQNGPSPQQWRSWMPRKGGKPKGKGKGKGKDGKGKGVMPERPAAWAQQGMAGMSWGPPVGQAQWQDDMWGQYGGDFCALFTEPTAPTPKPAPTPTPTAAKKAQAASAEAKFDWSQKKKCAPTAVKNKFGALTDSDDELDDDCTWTTIAPSITVRIIAIILNIKETKDQSQIANTYANSTKIPNHKTWRGMCDTSGSR